MSNVFEMRNDLSDIGIGKSWENIKRLRKEFLKKDDKLLKMHMPLFNPEGKGRFVMLLDPTDAEQVYRNEGKYPSR